MNLEPYYRKKKRMFNDMLEIGWSFRTILERLKLNYTDYIYLWKEKPEQLIFYKVVDYRDGENNNLPIPVEVDYLLDDGVYFVFNKNNRIDIDYISREGNNIQFLETLDIAEIKNKLTNA